MGNPFVHIELMTSDLKKSKEFYQSLFDWKLEEIPGMDYTMINVGQGTGGGMMKHPMPGSPSQWLAYVEVQDIATFTNKGQISGRNSHQAGDRDPRRRFLQHHHRSHRRAYRTVAAEGARRDVRRRGL